MLPLPCICINGACCVRVYFAYTHVQTHVNNNDMYLYIMCDGGDESGDMPPFKCLERGREGVFVEYTSKGRELRFIQVHREILD